MESKISRWREIINNNDVAGAREYIGTDEGFAAAGRFEKNDPWTPLHYAANKGRFDICKLLVEQGNVSPGLRYTDAHPRPLDLAHLFKYNRMIKYFKQYLKSNGLCQL